MEAAGASIVRHAAETRGTHGSGLSVFDLIRLEGNDETRVMDSADEEADLPSAVQDLIRRLEGEGEPITWGPSLTREPKIRDFFPERASLSTMIGWRRQVRLRVLEAIGSCNNLEYLNLQSMCEGDISRLTTSEWEVALRGFRSSIVLREISVAGLAWSSDAETESFCLQLGSILNTSSVRSLEIYSCKWSARCFLNLVSGLRRNSDSRLQSLDLYNAWEDSSAVKHVADIINSAPLLQTLILGGDWKSVDEMDVETLGILSQALIRSSSLKELVLEKVVWGEALLLKALAGDDGNRSIDRLRLQRMDRLGDCIRKLLTCNPSLKKLSLDNLQMQPEEWHQLGEVISDNAIATKIIIELDIDEDLGADWKSVEALVCAASSDVKDPVVHLQLKVSFAYNKMSLNLLGRVLRGEINSLESLTISGKHSDLSGSKQRTLGSIIPMNGQTGETSVLKRLELCVGGDDLWNGAWKDLLWALRGNTSLTYLELFGSKLNEEESFRDLMGLLQVNLTLQKIGVSLTSLNEKAALIEEALKQNQERAVYMSVFREAKLQFGDAKAGRLFLCCSPRAGKTKLRQTLMRIVQGKSWFGNKWEKLWRTNGIEVEFLQNNDQRQISIWDLAGQGIFRTLQNVLFPQTSNFCVFLFVYNPFCEKTSLNKKDSCFRTELEEWLSFITSSTRVSGHNRPQVLVVISHKDKARSISLTWAHSIMDDLTERFEKFIDLHPIQECFHVDARKKKQVIPLKNHIFEIFEKLLSEKSPRVPQLCSQLSSLLFTNTKENRSCPLWSSKKFYDFCAPSLTQLIPSSSAHAVDHSMIMNSILSYLNDVGSIVYIPNLDYIIVDPNWLTNTLLGELVALGQDFQAQESGSFEKAMSPNSYTSKDGFVSESVFSRLIEEFLRKQPHGQRGVDRKVIEKILINLDLCFKLEDTSQYFIPSFIREHASTEDKKYQEGAHVESMAWGTRYEVDSYMRRFNASSFDMFMRRKLILEMHVSTEIVICSRHYLRLFLDGHQIYVQQGMSHRYVDVLMLCSKHKSREEALKYLMKHIVQELISFCASLKGCPGVALVLGVIQTLCVELLIPSHLRGAILIEDLKWKFIRSIKKKLKNIPLDKSHLEKEEELFNYEHSWPLIEGHTTDVISERARDLLWESDVEAIVNEIRQKRMQQLESLQQGLSQQLESLQQGLIKVNNDLIHSYPENENMVTNSNYPDMKHSNQPSSRCLSRASTSVENRSTQLVLFHIGQLGQKVDGLDKRLRSMENIVQKLGQILSLQQELQSTLSAFISRVDRFIQYSDSLQLAITPKRPYVTDDVGLFYRISALLHVGTTVCLHLMCESATGFHPVKDQEGLRIRLDWENCGWIKKTIEISFKVMYYAAKAGLDVTLGLGQAFPDWGDLKSDIVKLDGISNCDRRAILKGGETKELKEAWLRIQQTLAPLLQDSYSIIFKLYKVKYLRLELGGHAWVCAECMKKGQSSGILPY